MPDISNFGSVVNVIASNSFPVGFPITQFSDDADPFDFPSIQIADVAMGVNGDLITWSRANPLPATLSVIVGSEDDIALQIIAKNNRVGKGKQNALDSITITVIYPDETTVTFTGGKMTNAMFGKSGTSQGRLKTRSYQFMFENVIGG